MLNYNRELVPKRGGGAEPPPGLGGLGGSDWKDQKRRIGKKRDWKNGGEIYTPTQRVAGLLTIIN